ncbi:nucleotidyl transferase AbiEii/AbiGii toxin family protein [Bacteroidota bacterium]
MKLHLDKNSFTAAIQATSDALNILPVFIEKDYWITVALKRLSESKYNDNVVFKGGTSLSKGYNLISRFSEDIDIAVINIPDMTGNQIKTLIRDVEKDVAVDLSEITDSPLTSKGSRFRKSVYSYPKTGDTRFYHDVSDKLIIEINSFANPYPYEKLTIDSLINLFLSRNSQTNLISKYGLFPFSINVLDKKQTLVEKLVSLFRFSFDNDAVTSITGKIRHFYDLYFLYHDKDCRYFIDSNDFTKTFNEVWYHDQNIFDEPDGWNGKKPAQSILATDFKSVWDSLKTTYITELSALAYAEIPPENKIADSFKYIMKKLLA